MKIAILGATGHIARNLVDYYIDKAELILFSRSLVKLQNLYDNFGSKVSLKENSVFINDNYNIVINATGITDGNILKANPEFIFEVTEQIDNLILTYLKHNPKTKVIHLSSGAVYKDFSKPVDEHTPLQKRTANSQIGDYYGIAKLESENRHRKLKDYFIVDLRVFAFFSKYIDLSKPYLMSEIVNCIKEKKILETNDVDIKRDFIHPEDLGQLVDCCLQKDFLNDSFDVYSKEPISKLKLLEVLKENNGLNYFVKKKDVAESATGIKIFYYSLNYKAADLGFLPKKDALNAVLEIMDTCATCV